MDVKVFKKHFAKKYSKGERSINSKKSRQNTRRQQRPLYATKQSFSSLLIFLKMKRKAYLYFSSNIFFVQYIFTVCHEFIISEHFCLQLLYSSNINQAHRQKKTTTLEEKIRTFFKT